ncbi:MAG: lamin tail domain-containing protein, partial [Bacteroidia bacterium]
PLVLGQPMYLTINNVADLAGNVMTVAQTFQVGLGGIGGNLIITEIMYNDAGAGNDQLEFIEIYNDENIPRNLMGYSFVGVNYVFPDTILAPYNTIIVAVNDSVFNATFSAPALEWTSGSLANTGETIKLLDALNNTIDSVTYDYQSPWSPLASGLGHSLMLCDLATDNSLASAWNPSAAYQGVYAGADLYSSPYALEACPLGDTLPPNFVQAVFINPTKLALLFDEPLDASGINSGNYNITPALNISNVSFGFTPDSVIFDLQTAANPCLNYDVSAGNISDLAGNVMPLPQTQTAVYCPDEGKIVITEIMYNNPGTDHLEFIEIYNADVKPINMKDFSFNSGITYAFPDTTMYPGEYWLIAAKPDSIMQYMNAISFQFTGSLLNTGELLQLVNSLGLVIDSVRYKNTAPWNNDANGTGPSLVLCNATLDNGVAANWSVATEYAGIYTDTLYASPKAACSGAPLTYIPLNDTTICASAGILDAGNSGGNFLWSTGETTQSITVTANGTYWVAVNNGVNFDTDTVTVAFAPTFTPNINIPDSACLGQPEPFADVTSGATSWSWNFGDGTTDSTVVAMHIYTALGAYPVSLTVSNGTCSAQVIQTIYVKDCGIGIENETSFAKLAQILPNPFTDELRIDLLRNTPQNIALCLTDITGKLIYKTQLNESLSIDTKSFAKGMYFVTLSQGSTQQTWKIVKE